MREATVTVAMPAYNAARTIGSAIRSALAQTRRDFELIVVDDGSTDDTAASVEPFLADERIRLVRQENRGLAGARNTAIQHARGEYVSLLDSDDLWLPEYLERVLEALEPRGDAAFAYADAWVLDDETRRIQRRSAMAFQSPPTELPRDPHALLLELLRRNFVYGSATIRRSVLAEIGPFDESLRASEDYELWLRAAARGYTAVAVPGLLSVYRRRTGTLSDDDARMLTSVVAVMRKVERWDVPEEARALARSRADAAERALERSRVTSGFAALRRNARLRAGALYRRLLWRRVWYDVPPGEVAAAFPDLRTL